MCLHDSNICVYMIQIFVFTWFKYLCLHADSFSQISSIFVYTTKCLIWEELLIPGVILNHIKDRLTTLGEYCVYCYNNHKMFKQDDDWMSQTNSKI